MAERSISVVMESTYRSDLSKGLRRDKQKLDEFQKYLDKRGLRIPVRIDLKGLQSQAGAMRKIVLGAFADIPASILGADGRPASKAASGQATNNRAGLLQRTTTTTYDKSGAPQTRVSELEQLGKGLTSVQTFKPGASRPLSTVTRDISNVNDLRDALRGMNDELRKFYGEARGRGDKAGQIAALREHHAKLTQAMIDASGKGLEHSPEYEKAENQVSRVSERIAALQGSRQTAAQKAVAKGERREYDKSLRAEEERVDIAQKANTQDLIRAQQTTDLAAREAKLNQLYQERRDIFTGSQAHFNRLDAERTGLGDPDGAAKANRRALNMAGHAAQADVERDRSLADLEARRAAALKAAMAKADAERKAQLAKQEAERKSEAAKAHADRSAGYARELNDIREFSDKRIAAINAAERKVVAETKNGKAKAAVAQAAHRARVAEYGNRAEQYGGVDSRARASGNTASADAARAARGRAEVAAAKDMQKVTSAAHAGGHALDFHSSALLRNAMTYARWMIPVKAVMGMTEAFMAGVNGAIKVNRQFAILQAVFQGTAEEAEKLKVGTLDLAASQGRSTDEAMDAAIRWSRLGLSRVGVLEAVRVSLQAANVAEISAAEAAENLSAIYATFRLNVSDLSGVLNALNSISNNYNVTVDDMFQGIARVGGIAKQSGLELMDLTGIIGSVVGATGRPGAEVGNALKFVITRLSSPDTLKALEKQFHIDLKEPNGELKDMSKVIRELADIFPTLNNAQKQTFLGIAAGTRQASRFALVLDQYRQGQALAAQAMNDTGVTAGENQLMLESLEGRINSLKSAWTRLFTAIGDAGAMDRAGAFFKYLQELTVEWNSSLDAAKGKAGELIVNDPQLATLIEQKGGVGHTLLQTRTRFSNDETKKALRELQKFVDEQSDPKRNHKRVGGDESLRMGTDSYWGLGSIRFKNLAEAQDKLAQLKKLIGEGGDQGPQDRLTSLIAPTTDLRNRIRQADTFRMNMEGYAKEVARGRMNPEKRYRDFETTARGLQNLPDGTALYSKAIGDYQGLARTNDNAGISALATRTADLFRDYHLKTSKEYEAAKPGVISKLEKDLDAFSVKRKDLQKQLAEAPIGGKNAIAGQLKELDQVAAATVNAIAELKDSLRELKESFFTLDEASSISKYLHDLVQQAKEFGDAFKDLSPDAENDPVERIFKRRRAAAGLAVDMLEELRIATAAVAQGKKAAAFDEIDTINRTMGGKGGDTVESEKLIAVQQRIIDQQDELNDRIETRIIEERKLRDVELDKLTIAERVATLARIQTDASKDAADSSLAWRFGETESDKNSTQARTALRRAEAELKDALASRDSEADSPAARADFAGKVLGDEAVARKDLVALKTRSFEIDAAQKQVAVDYLRIMREQTEEANKKLMLATREEQLRLAAMAHTIRDRRVTSAEFYGLSAETRKAMVEFLPGEAPRRLNNAADKAYKEGIDLAEEKVRLASAIKEISGGLEKLEARILSATGDNGALDPLPRASDGPLAPNVPPPNTRDTSPTVSLSIGQVNVQLGQQVERIISAYVDRNLAAMEERLARQFPRPALPNSQGVTE